MEFYEDFFVAITEKSRSETKYDALYKIIINEEKAIYIYHNALVADIIPFGVFKTETERCEFLDFINEKLTNEKE